MKIRKNKILVGVISAIVTSITMYCYASEVIPKEAVDRLSHEWSLVYLTGILAIVTGALAIYTAKLYRATVKLGLDAKESGALQMEKMTLSLLHAERGAVAMENVATATLSNAEKMSTELRKQMRAYISVDGGQGVYQDEHNSFEGKVVITNSGYTPARNVSVNINAGICSIGIDSNFCFPVLEVTRHNDASVSPRQSFVFGGVMSYRVLESEVGAVMAGNVRRLFVWGTVTYEDVYGASWHTNFCYNYIFFKNEKQIVISQSFLHPTNNDAI